MAQRALRVTSGSCRCGGTCGGCEDGNAGDHHTHALMQPAAANRAADTGLLASLGSGRPLAPSTRDFFEPRLERDLGHVRVHTGQAAAEAAAAVEARAFTVGRDIVFGRGRYNPGSASGRLLLTHELVHTIQQSATGSSTRPIIMRRWDEAPSDCAGEPEDRWIKKVVVNQETPQTVTVHWSDGKTESDECSAGKGHCCVDPAAPEGVACSIRSSRVSGSNCTPITTRMGYPVRHRDRDHKDIPFWTEFVPSRGIALHQWPRLDGTPLSHGCVRLHSGMAKKIFCGVRQNRTWVQVHGFARPRCDHPALRREWEGDFASGGRSLSDFDGDAETRASILETRRMLNASFGRKLTVDEIRDLTADDIPRCRRRAPLPRP